MAIEMRYPIYIPFQEQEIIKRILSDRKDRIPSLWKQLTGDFLSALPTLYITSFENGFLIGALSSQRDTVPECWEQLISIMNKIKEDAGVETTDLGNNMIQLKDREGFIIVRQKHDWE